jgi:hypothetical protein
MASNVCGGEQSETIGEAGFAERRQTTLKIAIVNGECMQFLSSIKLQTSDEVRSHLSMGVSIIILKVSGGQLASFVRAHRSRVVLCMMDISLFAQVQNTKKVKDRNYKLTM